MEQKVSGMSDILNTIELESVYSCLKLFIVGANLDYFKPEYYLVYQELFSRDVV